MKSDNEKPTTTYRALPNGMLVAHVPITFVRTPSGPKIINKAPSPKDEEDNLDTALVQTIALGMKYRNEAITDRFPTRTKMAAHYRFDTSYLTRMIRVGYLAPCIIEKIVAGDLPYLSIDRLQKLTTPIWTEQLRELNIPL